MVVAKWPDLYSNLVSAEISHRNFASIRAKKWNFCNCKKKLCFTQRNLDRRRVHLLKAWYFVQKLFTLLRRPLLPCRLSTLRTPSSLVSRWLKVIEEQPAATTFPLSISGSCITCNHVNSTSDDRNFSGFLPLLLISCSSTRNLVVVQLFFLL